MTNEGRTETDAWVRQHGMRHAYAYDDGDRLGRHFAVTRIPNAVLVDTKGTVLWQGSPASLDDAQVEAALAGALEKPLWEWPSRTAPAKQALLRGDYAGALQLAERMGEAYHEMVQGRVGFHVASVERALEAGDYLSAEESGQRALKLLQGLPEQSEVQALLDRLHGDRQALLLLDGQRRLRRLIERAPRVTSREAADALVEEMLGLERRHPGSYLALQAQGAVSRLRTHARRLR